MNEPYSASETSDETLLAAWRGGDQSAAANLFNRYLVRLTALARSRLSRRLARRVDPEDIVLSAYRSFFVAAADGRVAVPDDNDLWPLLVILVLRKVARNAERHTAGRRDVHRETALDSTILSAVIQHDPTPEQAAILDDELSAILARLSPRERAIVSMRLQGESEQAIATALSCSERTVRRALEHVRKLIVESGGLGDATWRHAVITPLPSAQTRISTPEPDTDTGDWPTIPYSDLQLLTLIGSGGIAKLYRGRWITAGRDVAVKFLRKRFWRNRPAVAGLLHEAQILRSIKHPQIVTLLGSGRTAKGAAFLVLPWIDGDDFDAWRRHAHPDVNDIVAAMLSAMDAVAAAHGAGVVHCDLKPGNLLRAKDGRIFLTDFGFAHSLRTGEPLFVRGGTAGFLAPEQCSDAFGEIERRTDVYGLGATLYALLCGRPPFAGRDLPDVLAQVVSSRLPPPPSLFYPASPAWLDAVVLRCLNKEPAERFDSAEELAMQIRRHAGVPSDAS